MNKGKEIFDLLKVPDNILLKLSREEIGQLKSYIDELTYELKKRDEEIKQLRLMTTGSEDVDVLKLKKKIENQKVMLAAQNKKIKELESRDLSNSYLMQISRMHKEIKLLQDQLIKIKRNDE